ncbi:prephenate dehydrogenase [Anaerovorax odorimutans]|uniref:prephenate dehydrogenase n=1 Tax=Anaerovorax odorimutans TaxID=109327 RepID=UPI000423EE6E|nr:prephenate dehydrogenase [Anaerovorax odorimutans]
MKVGIIGLGLIGGSIAKAIKQNTDNTVYGTDIVESVIYKAQLLEAIDGKLEEDMICGCDLIIIALYPKDTIDFIKSHADQFKVGSIILDCCGVKDIICETVKPIAEEKGFTFIGAHPMAGIEYSGFEHSKKSLFKNASMVLTPFTNTKIEIMDKLKKLLVALGFTNVQIASPKEHDKIIAFTSQLAHVVSSAYIKSPTAEKHNGFSAGSYKDLSRVAKLNEDMWTELFLLNNENLVFEIDCIIEKLSQYRNAIKDSNEKELWNLLNEGTERKISIG